MVVIMSATSLLLCISTLAAVSGLIRAKKCDRFEELSTRFAIKLVAGSKTDENGNVKEESVVILKCFEGRNNFVIRCTSAGWRYNGLNVETDFCTIQRFSLQFSNKRLQARRKPPFGSRHQGLTEGDKKCGFGLLDCGIQTALPLLGTPIVASAYQYVSIATEAATGKPVPQVLFEYTVHLVENVYPEIVNEGFFDWVKRLGKKIWKFVKSIPRKVVAWAKRRLNDLLEWVDQEYKAYRKGVSDVAKTMKKLEGGWMLYGSGSERAAEAETVLQNYHDFNNDLGLLGRIGVTVYQFVNGNFDEGLSALVDGFDVVEMISDELSKLDDMFEQIVDLGSRVIKGCMFTSVCQCIEVYSGTTCGGLVKSGFATVKEFVGFDRRRRRRDLTLGYERNVTRKREARKLDPNDIGALADKIQTEVVHQVANNNGFRQLVRESVKHILACNKLGSPETAEGKQRFKQCLIKKLNRGSVRRGTENLLEPESEKALKELGKAVSQLDKQAKNTGLKSARRAQVVYHNTVRDTANPVVFGQSPLKMKNKPSNVKVETVTPLFDPDFFKTNQKPLQTGFIKDKYPDCEMQVIHHSKHLVVNRVNQEEGLYLVQIIDQMQKDTSYVFIWECSDDE